MNALEEFSEILVKDAPLGRQTALRVGGNADFLAKPRHPEELARLVKRCRAENLTWRILGGGTNLLIPDDGVRGVVISLGGAEFRRLETKQNKVSAGAGVVLGELITHACKASLSGLEVLAGIPGTLGGALRKNAGERTGDIGQYVHAVEVMDTAGNITQRLRADIRFGYRQSNLDDSVILGATLSLLADRPDDIVRRVKKTWIAKKASQPFAFQATGYVFRNPRGLSAAELIDKAGLRGAKVGGAEVSDRDPKFVVAHEGTTSRDVLRLIDMVRSKVEERTGVAIELQVDIW